MQQLKIKQSVTLRTDVIESYLREISQIPMITPDEEIELAVKIQAGDDEAFQKLVSANLRFVVSVAKSYQNCGLELCDLINEGNIGLMKAAHKFDPSRGFKFISCAVWWIRQQIMQAMSDQGRMVRLPMNQVGMINKINKKKTEFAQTEEREPTNDELADLMNVTPEKISEAISCSGKHVSFDMPFSDESEGTLLDVIPNADAETADKGLEGESLHTDLLTVMEVLTPREREIICMCYGIGCREMSLEEIGARMGLTRERVRQLRERALGKLQSDRIMKKLAAYA